MSQAPFARVWLLDASIAAASASVFRSWLSQSEERRFLAFGRAQRRNQFLMGRGLLRLALGELLGRPARSVVLEDVHGRAPRLVEPLSESIGFSISHSGDWVACAVGAATQLGLDIELRDTSRDFQALAGHAFDPAVQAALAALPQSARADAFYRMWSEQEARFKLNAPCANAYQFDHPLLSIAACSSEALNAAPRMMVAQLVSQYGECRLTSLRGEGTAGLPVQ
ncbi:4'-phosphopantetheinyl transferase superfamily protein [Massilia sp. RP-1-19]|uniref:4'-phosphopantetheinyl transferase superfamily protein n=1 Tax=Massilia polaris TaxID=2728846 RepID=A0A848HJ17_9BURK|nr:4'-phosphopantetheinyl transferase superfamily protein [Massilia polaris]